MCFIVITVPTYRIQSTVVLWWIEFVRIHIPFSGWRMSLLQSIILLPAKNLSSYMDFLRLPLHIHIFHHREFYHFGWQSFELFIISKFKQSSIIVVHSNPISFDYFRFFYRQRNELKRAWNVVCFFYLFSVGSYGNNKMNDMSAMKACKRRIVWLIKRRNHKKVDSDND